MPIGSAQLKLNELNGDTGVKYTVFTFEQTQYGDAEAFENGLSGVEPPRRVIYRNVVQTPKSGYDTSPFADGYMLLVTQPLGQTATSQTAVIS